ncbi:TPA: nuclear transport factor 2 family protein [Pseudomonas putida]|nr:nuclear transport factor 2 family protein [Pseudomonas putida]
MANTWLARVMLAVALPLLITVPSVLAQDKVSGEAEILSEKVKWLVDRANITDLINRFAQSIDRHDASAYASLFTDDAVLELPFATISGRQNIASMKPVPAKNAGHHIASNYFISIDGATAVAQSYLQTTHVFDRQHPRSFEQAGGWYDYELRKTNNGWRFSKVKLSVVWESGDMMKETSAIPAS